MRNIKLLIEYDGTDFCGWQIQANDRTVQEELERSLSMLTEEKIKTTAAGRTDSGVHALGQVVNFKTNSELPLNAFVNGGNSRLPYDARIVSAQDVPANFSARYAAKKRYYRYFIAKRPIAVGRRYAWIYWKPLNLNVLQRMCEPLNGTLDFKSFCQKNAAVKHFLCHIYAAEWKETAERYVFDICANRFLHNMVRILVGTMVEGASGQFDTSMEDVLTARDRKAAGSTAPALGLFLTKVEY